MCQVPNGCSPFALAHNMVCPSLSLNADVWYDRTLGWTRVKLYRHQSEPRSKHQPAQTTEWALAVADQNYFLHSGTVPKGAVMITDPPMSGMLATSVKIIHLCTNSLKAMITPYWSCTVCVLMSQW